MAKVNVGPTYAQPLHIVHGRWSQHWNQWLAQRNFVLSMLALRRRHVKQYVFQLDYLYTRHGCLTSCFASDSSH